MPPVLPLFDGAPRNITAVKLPPGRKACARCCGFFRRSLMLFPIFFPLS